MKTLAQRLEALEANLAGDSEAVTIIRTVVDPETLRQDPSTVIQGPEGVLGLTRAENETGEAFLDRVFLACRKAGCQSAVVE